MAKEIFPCGGIGKHINGCECATGGSGSGLRRQKPGKTQGMLLHRLTQGKAAIEQSPWQHQEKAALEKMAERGWVTRTRGDQYEITDKGREAHQDWLED